MKFLNLKEIGKRMINCTGLKSIEWEIRKWKLRLKEIKVLHI